MARRLVPLMVALLAVFGCESAPLRKQAPVPVEAADPVQQTIARAQLATTAAARAGLYLDALQALHAQGAEAAAGRIIEQLRTAQGGQPLAAALAPFERFRLHAILFERALAVGDEAEVERQAARLAPIGPEQRTQAAQLRAQALERAGSHGAAARLLMEAAERFAGDGSGLSALAASVWRQLSRLSMPELDQLVRSASTPAMRTWAALARDVHAALTGSEQMRIWRQWQLRHPDHVARRFPPPSLRLGVRPPRNIALLIPLSGQLASAAQAIRDGFVSAYLHASRHAEDLHQTLLIYDTGMLSIGEAYRRAAAKGADLVVGPLEKAAVAELAALAPDLPVVALNQLDDPPAGGERFVQLALAVEDQATALATALAADGIESMVLFDNSTRWAARAHARLAAELDTVELVGVGTVGPVGEVTTVVGDALGITASRRRHEELSQLLEARLEFTPRRRDDVDAIVALVDARQLLSLKPALDFHFASDLPLYLPLRDGADLGRIDGALVCGIPWRLHPSPLKTEAAAFSSSRGASASLFALGVDGYRVANQLPRLTMHGESIAGSIGMLTLGEGGRVRRELVRARVAGRRLVPLTKGG